MSRVLDLCEDSDDNGEWSTTAAYVPSLSLSRKRRRAKEESANDDHPRSGKGSGNKTATDLELADEAEAVSQHKKRRGIMNGDRSVKSDVAGNCAQLLKGHHSDTSEETSRDDGGSANEHSQKLSTSGKQWRVSAWYDRLRELAVYREIHGHCNIPYKYSENIKLADWVGRQRYNYRLHLEGKISHMTISRIQELESVGFEWGVSLATWEDRLSELADYRKIKGHCNVPTNYTENMKLGKWVGHQRNNYKLHLKGKTSPMTLSRIQVLESMGFDWGGSLTAWEDRLSELADYRKIKGHCNVPQKCSENTKLASWVGRQRYTYRLHLEGKTSSMTLSRIQELESIGFEWGVSLTAWDDRLSELADYCKIHGHCNVPYSGSENTKLAKWVAKQRANYRLHREGKRSYMTISRIQELESMGFEWGAAKENRLSDLAEYRKIHGHCNVPYNCRENTKLAMWVSTQRTSYWLHREGKRSQMTLPRIQALEIMGFEWGASLTIWESRLSHLADYRKIHGHCNVPYNCRENTKLASWVGRQRYTYRLHLEGKTSSMTLSRIQALESMGFEWGDSRTSCEDRLSELADYRKIKGHCNVPTNYTENMKLANWVGRQRNDYRLYLEGKTSSMTLSRIQALESMGFEWRASLAAWKNRLSELVDYCKIHGHCNVPQKCSEWTKLAMWVANQRTQYRLHLKGKISQITLPRIHALERLGFEWKPSTRRGKGTPEKTSLDKDATRVRERAVGPPRLPRPAHEQKSINSLSHTILLVADPLENDRLVAAKKPTNTRQGAEIQLETAQSNEMLRTDPVAAEPLQQKHHASTHALLLGDGSTGSVVQVTSHKPANAAPDMQKTPQDEVFQSDDVLNKLEMELIWLGEESMYCLACPEFQFDFIYEYASPALKVELRKLSRDDQSETEKLKQVVRMEDRLVSRHFDFTRKDIRMNYF
jgi:hypothetical protein